MKKFRKFIARKSIEMLFTKQKDKKTKITQACILNFFSVVMGFFLAEFK